MAWTVDSVNVDDDKTNVGVVSMTWDTAGPDEFTYSKRVELIAANQASIALAAEAAKDAFLANRAQGEALKVSFQAWIDAH